MERIWKGKIKKFYSSLQEVHLTTMIGTGPMRLSIFIEPPRPVCKAIKSYIYSGFTFAFDSRRIEKRHRKHMRHRCLDTTYECL